LKDAISTQGTLKWLHFHTTSLQHAKSGALRDAKNSTGSDGKKERPMELARMAIRISVIEDVEFGVLCRPCRLFGD
jgi:hypothetical protein